MGRWRAKVDNKDGNTLLLPVLDVLWGERLRLGNSALSSGVKFISLHAQQNSLSRRGTRDLLLAARNAVRLGAPATPVPAAPLDPQECCG